MNTPSSLGLLLPEQIARLLDEQPLKPKLKAEPPQPTPTGDEPREVPVKPRRKKRKRKSSSRAKARSLGRARRLAERRKFFLDLRALPDDAVLTIPEWQTLNTLSERQARRILASGEGPVVTWLSAKRKGITVRANREWQEARACGR
jgi:hypothetical protein